MVAPGAGVRGRGSSIGSPGAGLRIAFAKNLRGQGSRLSTRQAEGGPHASEEAAPPPTVGFRGIDDDDVYDQFKMGQMAGNLEKREKTSLLPSLEAA